MFAGEIASDVLIGLLGAGLAAAVARGVRWYRNWRLKRRYPVSGRYISYFDDEKDGKPFIVTSETEIRQNGLLFRGVNNVEGGKSWELQGRIIREGYLSGAYLAESPYDPGNGTFFLKIDGNDLDGLWSGYDSVNRSITGGRYWFKRIMPVQVVDYEERNCAAALSIADEVLGAGYLNDLSDGDGFHDTRTILAKDGDRVVGFCTFRVEPEGFLDSSPKYRKVRFSPDLRAADRRGVLGHIRIVGVPKEAQGRGIGSALVEEAERRLLELGATAILVFGWTSPDGTHIGGILDRLGYVRTDSVDNFWTEESLEAGYDCAVCGNPCNCQVIVFKKAP